MKKGSHLSGDSKQKLRVLFSGKNNPMYGKTCEQNPRWKGDRAGYYAIHAWIRRRKGKPEFCEVCQREKPVELSSVSGECKRDVDDFQWLCRRCHIMLEGRLNNLQQYKEE